MYCIIYIRGLVRVHKIGECILCKINYFPFEQGNFAGGESDAPDARRACAWTQALARSFSLRQVDAYRQGRSAAYAA